jgi:hypothetical protein
MPLINSGAMIPKCDYFGLKGKSMKPSALFVSSVTDYLSDSVQRTRPGQDDAFVWHH